MHLIKIEAAELLTTTELATLSRCQPNTVRRNHSILGHHHGIRPVKQVSGRLLWRKSDVEAMLNGGV